MPHVSVSALEHNIIPCNQTGAWSVLGGTLLSMWDEVLKYCKQGNDKT